MEEISWRQKLRELWLKEEDRNMGFFFFFFHKMTTTHKRRNFMVKIKINGAWVVEERKIKEGVVQVFHSLLSKTGEWRSSYNGLSIEVLGGEDAAMLEVQFSEEEVFCALLDLSGDKASSLDGFSMAFWQFNWDFLKEEVMEFLRDFMSRAGLLRVLIPLFWC